MTFLKRLLDVIFPPRCIFCRELLETSAGKEICSDCFNKIPFTAGNALPYNGYEGLDGAVSACEYTGVIREALIRYKFRNKPGYGRTLSGLIGKAVEENYSGREFDIIISVPLHRERKFTRGYNQALLLSRELSRKTGIKDASQLLVRYRHTEAQSLLDKGKRHENIKGAFRVTKPEMISGKGILLVDDIMTTGSTLNECGRVLKEAGASYVAAVVVAAARKK